MFYRGLYSYRQRVRVITRFPNIFSYCFCILSEFVKVFERKVWRVQAAHLHNAAGGLSSPSRCFSCQDKYSFRYLWYFAGKKTNRMWFIVVCTLVDNDTGHHSGQNVVKKIELHHKARALLNLVIECVISIHPWANSRWWISQSERALCFNYVIIPVWRHSFAMLPAHGI